MLYHPITALGRKTVHGLEEYGYGCALLAQSLYWLIVGPFIGQPVAVRRMFAEMMRIGVQAIPIVVILAFTNGVMLAIQGIYTLKDFNAESQVIPGIALSVTREFAVLIVGIVVAGRSGSAIAARIGAMNKSLV